MVEHPAALPTHCTLLTWTWTGIIASKNILLTVWGERDWMKLRSGPMIQKLPQ